MGSYADEHTLVIKLTEYDLGLIEASDLQYPIWKAPRACEIVHVWTHADTSISGGSLKITLADRGVAGTATAVTLVTHGTASAFTAGTPVIETITEGTLAGAYFVDVKLENESAGLANAGTLTVNSLVLGLTYVTGGPASSG